MRGFAINLTAAAIIAALTGIVGVCNRACDDTDEHADSVEMSHCATHCVCHSYSLPAPVPVVVAPHTPQFHRLHDEQLDLPVVVADIFNPPKA
ncbi:MAG: hypothetical protein PCFJNLEI_01782 [Verrucomicrobiae bacterium]|nr:hypothetical protein [Verrucomicrobiae bacterium]